MSNDELLVDVLKAAGHHEAANLASKLLATSEKPSQSTPEPEAAPASRALSPEEAAREAEGQAFLAAMKRDLPDRFA